MKTFPSLSPRAQGFTLIEVMVTCAIVALVTVIALPIYQGSVQKARRSDAKNALLDLAAREERYFATNNTYTATATSLGYSAAFPIAVTNGGVASYTLNVTAATTSTFTAVATRGTPQANDACGDYQLTDQGTQSNVNYTSLTPPCW